MFPESKLPKNWEELVAFRHQIHLLSSTDARLADDALFYKFYKEVVPKEVRYQILFATMEGNNIKILHNTFPYSRLFKNIPNKIGHYCLWSKKGQLTKQEIESELKKEFPKKEYCWVEHPQSTRSIPEIWHCQIFVKED